MQETIERREPSSINPVWDIVIVITILCSLGFPGKLQWRFGSAFGTAMNYAPFFWQIAIMLFSSSTDVREIKIINVNARFLPIYQMLVIWFVLSMLVTSFPTEQVIACVRLSVTGLFAIWIIEKYSIERIVEMTCFAQLLLIFFTAVAFVLMRDACFSLEYGERIFCGLFETKNPCAAELSFGLVMQTVWFKLLSQQKKRPPFYFMPLFVGQLVLLLLCKATGSLFCAAIPMLYLAFFMEWNGKIYHLPLGVFHVASSVGFLVVALTILPMFKWFFDLIGKDVTLTNRTPMWNQLIQVMTNHNTFSGFGFSMFWKDPLANKLFHEGFRRNTWGNTMNFGAHNALLEIWVDSGLIGVVSYFAMLLIAFRRISKIDDGAYMFGAAYIIWQTIKGLTERSYIPFNYQTFYLFLSVAAACVGHDTKKTRRTRESVDKMHLAEGVQK